MMIKKILVVIGCLLLTGCYDYKEINTLAILSATSIDYQDGEYMVVAQEINPQAPDKTAVIQAPFFLYTGAGNSLQEAYREITTKSSKFLYSHHLQLLLISENVAKEKLDKILDFYLRNPAIRTEFNVLLYKGDNPLDIITPINDISSASILETLETNMNYLGTSKEITFNEVVDNYLKKGEELVLPVIKVNNSKEDGNTIDNVNSSKVKQSYQLDNLAVFKDNKLVGYLDKEEALGYNYIKNNIKNTVLSYECEKDKYITLEIVNSGSKISSKKEKITIEIDVMGNINESTCSIDLEKENNLKKIQEEMARDFDKRIKGTIDNVIKEYNSDIYGFLDMIYKSDYDYYKKIKNDKNYLKKFMITVKSKVNIKSSGNLVEGINEKDK